MAGGLGIVVLDLRLALSDSKRVALDDRNERKGAAADIGAISAAAEVRFERSLGVLVAHRVVVATAATHRLEVIARRGHGLLPPGRLLLPLGSLMSAESLGQPAQPMKH
jgi:hypothetical protein